MINYSAKTLPRLNAIMGGIESVKRLEAYSRVPSPPKHTIISIFDKTQVEMSVVFFLQKT